MNIALITGANGLIGGEAVEFFSDKFDLIIGVDNNLRSHFFGNSASTHWNKERLVERIKNFRHYSADIRDYAEMETIFKEYGKDIKLIVHAAGQPSHDWAAKEPLMDFSINAMGTLNMLELCRCNAPDAVFIFTSTSKVYGTHPNALPLVEFENRWEVEANHPYFKNGIDEQMSIDQTMHSLFGASKVSADVMVQEYGRYYGLKTGVFRCGCLTGSNHAGVPSHGFLAYLMKCVITGQPYIIYGYKGKQVRDNIHSFDLVNMFWYFYQKPVIGEVFNAGGGRFSNCSILEAIELCENIAGTKLKYSYVDTARKGDHIWYISDVRKFKTSYPEWNWTFDLQNTLADMYRQMNERIKILNY